MNRPAENNDENTKSSITTRPQHHRKHVLHHNTHATMKGATQNLVEPKENGTKNPAPHNMSHGGLEALYESYVPASWRSRITDTGITQKLTHVKEIYPEVRTVTHHGSEAIMLSGAGFLVIAGILSIRKIIRGLARRRKRRSPLVVKAPITQELDNRDIRIRSRYPNEIVPVYGVKLGPNRKTAPDTPSGIREFETIKSILRLKRNDICQCCGLDFPGHEFHHLNDNHRDHRPENLAMLCRYCHMQYHVDVALSEGGLSGLFPDISTAELAHLQQYRDWVENHISHSDDKDIRNRDLIRRGIKYRLDLAMRILQSNKGFPSFVKTDQILKSGGKPPAYSKREREAFSRFITMRLALKVAYYDVSAKDNSFSGASKPTYAATANKFINADRLSFPDGRLDKLIARLNSEPELPQPIKDILPPAPKDYDPLKNERIIRDQVYDHKDTFRVNEAFQNSGRKSRKRFRGRS